MFRRPASHISVKDTGIGIASEALDSIFNAFEQAEKNTSVRYGGTGLGLAISSRLVQMMGGTLGVRSVLGEGSEFYFTLTLPIGSWTGRHPAAESRSTMISTAGVCWLWRTTC